MLWVANGGTSIDSGGNVQNHAWQKYPSLIEQYAVLIQDSDTYSLALDDDSRFVRSFTTGGWGAWKRLADGTNGWVELVSNVAAHDRVSETNVITHEIEGNFDASHFEEIEIEVESFGIYSDEGFANGGIHGNVQLRRTPGRSWTAWNQSMELINLYQDTRRGSYKVRMNYQQGVSVAQGDDYMNFGFAGNLEPVSVPSHSPHRKYSFMVHLIGNSQADENTLVSIKTGPFSVLAAYTRLTVRMR